MALRIYSPLHKNCKHIKFLRLVYVTCLVVLIISSALSQVKIREKAIITPQATVYRDSSESDRLRQPAGQKENRININKDIKNTGSDGEVILTSEAKIHVKVVEGNAAACINLVLRSPESIVIVQDANKCHGFEWTSQAYPAGSVIDVGIFYIYYEETGSEYGVIKTQLDNSTYRLAFEDRNVAPLYVDLIVEVTIVDNEFDHYAVRAQPDTLDEGENAIITVQAQDVENNEVIINHVLFITMMISGSEFGYLEGPDGTRGKELTGIPYSIARDGGVKYIGLGDSTGFYAEVENPQIYVQDQSYHSGTGPITVFTERIDHFEVWAEPDTVDYSKTAKIFVQAKDRENNDLIPKRPRSLTMYIQVPGDGQAASVVPGTPVDYRSPKTKFPEIRAQMRSEGEFPYGYFRSSEGVNSIYLYPISYTAAHDNGVEYVAEGDSLINRTITEIPIVVCNDNCSQGSVRVRTSSILVTVNPSIISTGDTASISVQKKKYDGTIEDFPPGQLFEIGTVEGCMAGHLLTTGGSGNYFKDVQQPFKFVAADSVDSTNSKILIRVGIYETSGGGGGGSADSFRDVSPSDKPDSLSMKKQASQAKLKDIKPSVSIRGASNPARPASGETCNADAFQYQVFGEGEAEVKRCSTIDEYIKNEYLDKQKPDPRITHMADDMFEIKYVDNSRCDPSKPDQVGYTFTEVGSNNYDYSMNSLTFYLTRLHFTIEWGYCIDKLENRYGNSLTYIDFNNLPKTESEAVAVISDFTKFERTANGRIGIRGSIVYYPISEIKAHEFIHIGQYKDKLTGIFNDALIKINNLSPPPKDWCKDLVKWIELEKARRDEIESILKTARESWKQCINLGFDENPAYKAGWEEIGKLIDTIRNTKYN